MKISHETYVMIFSFRPFPRIKTHFTSIVYEGTAYRCQRGEKYTHLGNHHGSKRKQVDSSVNIEYLHSHFVSQGLEELYACSIASSVRKT